MHRRFALALTASLAAVLLASGTAAAAPADDTPTTLTPREQAGLDFAGQVLAALLAAVPPGRRAVVAGEELRGACAPARRVHHCGVIRTANRWTAAAAQWIPGEDSGVGAATIRRIRVSQ